MLSLKQPHLTLCVAVKASNGVTLLYPVRGIFRRRELANLFMREHPGTSVIDTDNDCRIYVCDDNASEFHS